MIVVTLLIKCGSSVLPPPPTHTLTMEAVTSGLGCHLEKSILGHSAILLSSVQFSLLEK